MRVLVTGHLGYLGSVLTPLLTDAGHQVTGLDTGLYADCLLGQCRAKAAPVISLPNLGVRAEF